MKFPRPNAYNGRKANQAWTGEVRFAKQAEVNAETSNQLAISPATLAATLTTLLQTGSSTLVGGTKAIAVATIGANDLVFVTRSDLNASPDLGMLTVAVAAGVGFTVTSRTILGVQVATDVSKFNYFIISM